jgi:quercetin dioxygenase-like cupin family protein
MKKMNLFDEGGFSAKAFKKLLVHDSENFRIINFNFEPGQELPVHSHDLDGELSITVLEGEGEFLGENGAVLPARTGDVLVSRIRDPHGVRAASRMRVLVTIAPPL